MRTHTLAVGMILFALSPAAVSAQTMKVVIVDRQTSDTDYSYVVPGQLADSVNRHSELFRDRKFGELFRLVHHDRHRCAAAAGVIQPAGRDMNQLCVNGSGGRLRCCWYEQRPL